MHRGDGARRGSQGLTRWLAAGVLALSALLGLATLAEAQSPPGGGQGSGPQPLSTPTATPRASGTPAAGSLDEGAALDAVRGLTRLSDLGYGDSRATGERAFQEFFFPGPGDFTLGQNSTLTVEIAHSNLLLPDRSIMNIVLNNRPLRAIYLDQTNVNGAKYVIPVPRDLIRKDFNTLRLEYAMSLGIECGDPNNPALYAVVFSATQLALDFAENPPVPVLEPPNLSAYPYPFFRSGYPVVATVTIVVPDNPTDQELTVAYRLATDLASRVSFDLARLQLKQRKDVSTAELAANQIILIGTPARMPLVREILVGSTVSVSGDKLRRANADLPADHGVLVLSTSPWNRILQALAITGQNDQALQRDIDALTNPEPTALFAGPETILTEPVAVERSQGQFLTQFSFQQVGFGDREISSTDTFNLTFNAPQVAANSSGQIDLIVSTPDAIDRRRSNMVVSLNGQQIQTIELRNEQTRRTSYRITMPSDQLRTGPNQLSFFTSLYTQDQSQYGFCSSAALERVWAIIHNDSAISLPQVADQATIAKGTTLASLPFPFAGIFGLQDTTFLVDPTRAASLRGGMLAAIGLGRRAGARSRFDVRNATAATPQNIGQRHVIAVGIPADSAVATEVGKVLPLVFGPGGSRALVAQDETLTAILDTARLGALQMAPVPWANNFRVLSFSGADDETLGWVTKAITERPFDGNVALFQSPTLVNTFSLERLSDDELARQLADRFTERESLLMQLAAFLLVGGGAVLMLLIWAFRGSFRLFRWRR